MSLNQSEAAVRSQLDEVKNAAEKLTKRRLEEDGLDMHQEKENWVNNTEGVTESTPVSQARVQNPAEPDFAPAGIPAEDVAKKDQSSVDKTDVGTTLKASNKK